MRTLRLMPFALLLWLTSAFPQSNRIVFGPLEGEDAGVLTVQNGQNIGIELWVRTDPDNPTPIVGIAHGLMSEDVIIAQRNGINLEYPYNSWFSVWVDGPFVYDPDDAYPIPTGWTCEMQGALCHWPPECVDPLDTQGEWDLYGTWLMVTNTGIPIEQTYYPFEMGWYPHSGQGTYWSFETPPGGGVEPEQSYCGLYFVPECDYIYGDCNHNGTPWELADLIAMIGIYRGAIDPYYTCYCPPHGDDYPPGADPDGDCIPYELSDVIIMLRPPDWPIFGCPDCLASDGLLDEEKVKH